MSQKNLVRKRFKCSEEVPAFSVVAVTAGAGDYRMGFTVAKPTGADNAYAGTGKSAGTAGLLTMGEDLIVRYTGTIAEGDRCRPKPGDWVMEKNSAGQYVCVALYEKGDLQVAAFRKDQESGTTLRLIQAPSGGIPGRQGSLMGGAICSVVTFDTAGQLTVSADTMKVYNWAQFAACSAGDRYGIAGWVNSAWLIVSEDCGDSGSTVKPKTLSLQGGSVPELFDFSVSTMSLFASGQKVGGTTPSGGTGGGVE